MNESESLRPLFSVRADDPDIAGDLGDFLLALTGRIDELQDAHFRGETDVLSSMARSFARDAEWVGYEILATAAQRVQYAADRGKSEEAHSELVELTELAQRARRAHRGSLG
ncbi:MAG: hypothetical protein QF890_00825 [Myxococcota bacterium]|jgi:hypothetical protein|nr:hypothetical protein [Deltaproteobacteria bacterium]MCP4242259.1 hypothetical protein [bacterium]MDP6075254.1 hypothetical protein [Myxococcota bacterium]MDP6244316.1 hypothetical protein [Myxococcota bacterium]MDP7074253.1 hypothetical protein [Myxococcota bacterium]